jgi:hypothetical protein
MTTDELRDFLIAAAHIKHTANVAEKREHMKQMLAEYTGCTWCGKSLDDCQCGAES